MSDDPKREWDVGNDEIKKAMLTKALEAEHGNVTRAAALLGITRQHATKLVREVGLLPLAQSLRAAARAAKARTKP